MRKNLQFPKKHPGELLQQKMRCAAITGLLAFAGSASLYAGIKPANLLVNPITKTAVSHSNSDALKSISASVFKFDHEINGIVTDQNGNPLQGVSVQVKGTNKGVITTATGRFSLSVPENATLTVSSVGYETKEVKVGSSTTITIELKVAASDLNEVVVVGYGTQKKANLTGAVSQVSSEVLDNRSLPNLTQGLQGQIPNLNITMLDGKPTQSPSYNVRGTTSIGQGGSALVLIDGVEGDPSLINPNDVASVTVLKDAASSAIYGARAAFGVVLITTKSAKKGKTAIAYSSNYSFKSPTAIPDEVNNGYEYAKMFSEAYSAGSNYTQLPKNINKTQKFSQ
jgi:TonB-dependent SusC/RagA subfamily outer membrane receptor